MKQDLTAWKQLVAGRLVRSRKEAGYKSTASVESATDGEVKASALYSYESAKNSVPPEKILLLADLYRKPPAWLYAMDAPAQGVPFANAPNIIPTIAPNAVDAFAITAGTTVYLNSGRNIIDEPGVWMLDTATGPLLSDVVLTSKGLQPKDGAKYSAVIGRLCGVLVMI